MFIRYKLDVIKALKDAGYSTYYIRQSKILCEDTLQAIRSGRYVAPRNLAKLSILLRRPLSDIAEYLTDDSDLNWVESKIDACPLALDAD